MYTHTHKKNMESLPDGFLENVFSMEGFRLVRISKLSYEVLVSIVLKFFGFRFRYHNVVARQYVMWQFSS